LGVNHLSPPQIVQVDDAKHLLIAVHDDNRGDLAAFERVQDFHSQRVGADGDRVARHDGLRPAGKQSGVSAMCRRRSPSVMMPPDGRHRRRRTTSQFLARDLVDHLAQLVARGTIGACSPEVISWSARINRFPSFPPGCRLAKSSWRKPLATSSVIASASPKGEGAVVLAVGTRLSGHASFETWQSSATSAALPSVDCGSPVIVIRLRAEALDRLQEPAARRSLRCRQRRHDIVRLEHAQVAVNRLGGCRKKAGVPVLERVAAIFRQMMPDLPMPVTITRPAAVEEEADRPLESFVEAIDQPQNGGRFRLQHGCARAQSRA
jgi:hypothetical protein